MTRQVLAVGGTDLAVVLRQARAALDDALNALGASAETVQTDDLIPIVAAAERAGVSVRTIRRWVSANGALGHKIGRRWWVGSGALRQLLAHRGPNARVRKAGLRVSARDETIAE